MPPISNDEFVVVATLINMIMAFVLFTRAGWLWRRAGGDIPEETSEKYYYYSVCLSIFGWLMLAWGGALYYAFV